MYQRCQESLSRCNALPPVVKNHLKIHISVGAMPVHTGHHDVALEIPGLCHQHCVIQAVSRSWIQTSSQDVFAAPAAAPSTKIQGPSFQSDRADLIKHSVPCIEPGERQAVAQAMHWQTSISKACAHKISIYNLRTISSTFSLTLKLFILMLPKTSLQQSVMVMRNIKDLKLLQQGKLTQAPERGSINNLKWESRF